MYRLISSLPPCWWRDYWCLPVSWTLSSMLWLAGTSGILCGVGFSIFKVLKNEPNIWWPEDWTVIVLFCVHPYLLFYFSAYEGIKFLQLHSQYARAWGLFWPIDWSWIEVGCKWAKAFNCRCGTFQHFLLACAHVGICWDGGAQWLGHHVKDRCPEVPP